MGNNYIIPPPGLVVVKTAFNQQEAAAMREGIAKSKLTIQKNPTAQKVEAKAIKELDIYQVKTNPYIRGVKTIVRKPNGNNEYKGKIDQTTNADAAIGRSPLGTLVYADVTFASVTYTDNDGKSVTTPRMTFQSILISVSFPRFIVKTQIQGRNGQVKEYIGEDDAQITFRGVICGPNGHYPATEVAALKKIIKAPVEIPVISSYLQNLDIATMVFEDRELEQEEGGYSYQTFSLNAVSDVPQELKISGF